MQIVIQPAGVAELVEPENTRAFSASFSPTVAVADRSEAVAASGVGELDGDGQHIYVRVEVLRQLAAGRVGPSWEDEFSAMLAYARKKGWMNDSGDSVRAHVEPR
jgi:hypothetical protein